jgi:hypothetical protein
MKEVTNMMISKLFIHDSKLKTVIENCESNEFTFSIYWPKDWQNNIFVDAALIFENVTNYEVHEGPFSGCPTIIEMNEIENKTDELMQKRIIKIQTNAGYRTLTCTEFQLIETMDNEQ